MMGRFRLAFWPRRPDQARNHAIDGDAVRSKVMGERPGEADDAGLCCHYMGAVACPGMCAQAPDIDNGPLAALLQMRQASLYAMKGAVQRDIHDLAPFGIAHLSEWLFTPQRRVVDENVNTAELLDRCLHHRLHLRGIGHVSDMHERL